jgi:hypothetical protein
LKKKILQKINQNSPILQGKKHILIIFSNFILGIMTTNPKNINFIVQYQNHGSTLIIVYDSFIYFCHSKHKRHIVGSVERSFTFDSEQRYKWVRHHTFIQNLKTLGLWVIPLINASPHFFKQCRINSPNTCPIQVWFTIFFMIRLKWKHFQSHAPALSLLLLKRPLDHLCKEEFWYKELVKLFIEPSTLIPLLEEVDDHSHWAQNNYTIELCTIFLPKTLRN